MLWIFPWCGQKAYPVFIAIQLKDLFYTINQNQFHFWNIISVYDSIMKLQ